MRPHDIESQKFLKKFNLKYNKVASAMLTNLRLIDEIAKEKKPTFISTGMSTINDIKKQLTFSKKENVNLSSCIVFPLTHALKKN